MNVHERATGLGEYEYRLGSELSSMSRELMERDRIRLTFILYPEAVGVFGDAPVRYVGLDRATGRKFRSRFKYRQVAHLLPHLDLVHFATQIPPLRYGLNCPTLMTMHDINFMHDSSASWAYRLDKGLRTLGHIRHADRIVFISDFVRRDVARHFFRTKNCDVIHNGVVDLTGTPQKAPDRPIPQKYLLHISRLSPNKNVDLQIRMMNYLPDHTLVLAGGFTHDKRVLERLLQLKQQSRHGNILFLGPVSEEEKAWLLAHSEGMLFPSQCEGFGLPVAEQMLFGRPVFCSRLTSLPEVGGDEACYFDSLEPAAMADVVRRGLADFAADAAARSRSLRQRALSFNWHSAAIRYLDIYKQMLNTPPSKR